MASGVHQRNLPFESSDLSPVLSYGDPRRVRQNSDAMPRKNEVSLHRVYQSGGNQLLATKFVFLTFLLLVPFLLNSNT